MMREGGGEKTILDQCVFALVTDPSHTASRTNVSLSVVDPTPIGEEAHMR